MTDPQPLSPEEEAVGDLIVEAWNSETPNAALAKVTDVAQTVRLSALAAARDELRSHARYTAGIEHPPCVDIGDIERVLAARATAAAPDLRAAAEAVVDTYDHGLREAGPRGWDALIDGLRAALAAPEAGERPGPGDYPAEGPVPTSVQNAWNEYHDRPSQPSRDALDVERLARALHNGEHSSRGGVDDDLARTACVQFGWEQSVCVRRAKSLVAEYARLTAESRDG